jgi:hypothetical protein
MEESSEGGFTAKASNLSRYTQAQTIDDLKEAVKDEVNCHFDDGIYAYQLY